MADFIVPLILFVLFALFSSIGAFLIVTRYRGDRGDRGDGSRAAGIVAALLTLFFFAALFLGLLVLMPPGTLPGI